MEKAVVSNVLATVRDLLSEEAKFLYGLSGEVKGLQTQLREIRCLLEDADKRRHESKVIGNWLTEIKGLAYRAEDAIETYAVEVSSDWGFRGLKELLQTFCCILNESCLRHRIGTEISEIKSEFARVSDSMQKYGIRSIIQGESSIANDNDENQKWLRQTFPYETEDCFVGRDEELEEIVSRMVDNKEHRVVSVWGMGGIGKTTIARKVYGHNQTRRFFESFAWVCITQECRIRSVLEDVLKQLILRKDDDMPNPSNTELLQYRRDDISTLSRTELVGQLRKIQQAKRCMIVLDDLWQTDHWDGLKHAFLVQDSRSKILVTTRKEKVADRVGFTFELGLLSADDGLELLMNKAFPRSDIPDFALEEKMHQIGKEMVRKCGYLPLAISLLGGILSKKKSMMEWELVDENINAYLYKGDDTEKENEIHGVLDLSYEDLPYYLKPCFLYIGTFKRGQTIFSDNLYRLWIALGMISHENQGNGENLMDIAESYLSELASRCIVQVQVDNFTPKLKYKTCKLHDVVLDLCLSKGKKEDFAVQILDYQGEKFHESLPGIKTRHLVIHSDGEMESNEFPISPDEDSSKHVRSLRFFNHVNGKTIEFPHTTVDFRNFKLVRVLVFIGFSFAGRKLPEGIDKLIHLRILSVERCELDELPSSISNLVYLHTLVLLNAKNIRVPNVLKKMSRLKHIFLPLYNKEKVENHRLGLEGLDELETLHGFDSLVHEFKSVIRLKNVRRFVGVVRDNESLSAIINAITTNWKNLRICAIKITEGCKFTSTEEGSMNLTKLFTCPSVHQLVIDKIQMGKLLLLECANQIIMSKLARLHLVNCEIEGDPMEIVERFPFLEVLVLAGTSYVGEEMTCHASGFCSLKRLVLRGLPNLREWRVEQGAMPLLSAIEIHNCPHLKVVPDGLRFMATLQKLTISGMAELGKRASRGGEDFDKVSHVPSIIIVGDN